MFSVEQESFALVPQRTGGDLLPLAVDVITNRLGCRGLDGYCGLGVVVLTTTRAFLRRRGSG